MEGRWDVLVGAMTVISRRDDIWDIYFDLGPAPFCQSLKLTAGWIDHQLAVSARAAHLPRFKQGVVCSFDDPIELLRRGNVLKTPQQFQNISSRILDS